MRIWVAAATGLALALRLLSLGSDSLWGDEAFTWHMTTFSWSGLLVSDASVNFPAYYLLAKASVAVFGEGEAALRLPAALFMAAAVPFIALLARRIAGPVAGIVAAFVAALAPTLLHYGQEARAYALLVFASAATLVAFARARESGRARDGVALGVAGGFLLHAHPYGILEVLGLGLVTIARWIADRRCPRASFGGLALAGALFAPLLPGLARRAEHVADVPWLEPAETMEVLRVPGRLLHWGGGDLLPVLLGALVVVACVLLPRPWRRLAAVLALCCWIAPAIHSRFGTPVFSVRYPLGLAPLAVAAIGALAARGGRAASAAAVGLVLALAVHYLATPPHRPDWRTVFAELRGAKEEGATPVVVARGTRRVAAYYFREEVVMVADTPKGTGYRGIEPLPPGRIAVVSKPLYREAILEAANGRAIVREMPRTKPTDQLFLVLE
jgi:mannosyltransferase